ncbi:thioesterase-like superfamily-domain-containing protein [Leucosporidium creatinivorum]|uniref:Thioesterase-like superfamily-domain-containing protein n=1 Tax=Leucosporidium creatinivorum TaxID=106004 RepID=A0A1Y2FJL0_9BASI|nr:thioesterase-like superfamily-domain-containing protein [Leucosporidium creatinivorum]
MVSLTSAISSSLAYERGNGASVYNAAVSETYTIGSVPHGGYILSIITQAALQYQKASSPHHDPAHLSADFLKPSSVGACQVEISTFTQTQRWTRLDVALYQYTTPGDLSTPRILKVRGSLMFTTLPPLLAPAPPSKEHVTVLPHTPIPEARICPLKIHPSQCEKGELYRSARFSKECAWSEKVGVLGSKDEEGRGRLSWGAWWEMSEEADDVRSNVALVPFFADQFRNGVELLEGEHSPGLSWFPTLTFSLQFISRFPLAAIPTLPHSKPAPRTVGLYSTTKFSSEGRHDITVEVWSAPSGLGEKVEVGSDEWRKEAQILGVSTQMALTLPFEINQRQGRL